MNDAKPERFDGNLRIFSAAKFFTFKLITAQKRGAENKMATDGLKSHSSETLPRKD